MKFITKLFIVIDIIVVLCFALVYGPYDKARVFWITTSQETLSHGYFSNIFYSVKTIRKVMSQNYMVAVNEETNPNDITIGAIEKDTNYESIYEKQILEHDDTEDYKLVKFKYASMSWYMIVIYDPTRINVATASNYVRYGETLTTIAKNSGAIAAINGGGYSWTDSKAAGLVVNEGKLLYAQSSNSYVSAAFNSKGVLMVGKLSASELEAKDVKYALSFGPALVVNGKSVTIRGTGGSGKNPRTALAQRKDGIVLFIVANGYDNPSLGRGGVYINELLTILERYKAYNAINMDGGSSTTMVLNNELINNPCDPVQDGQDFVRTAWIFK